MKLLSNPGALIRVKAPRQMGKSSLMMRILDHASKESYKTAFVNFQSVDAELLGNLDLFLQWFAASITDALNLPEKLEEHWKGVLGSKNKCTNYFQRYLLPSIDTPVALVWMKSMRFSCIRRSLMIFLGYYELGMSGQKTILSGKNSG
jgi:hypothetical protein